MQCNKEKTISTHMYGRSMIQDSGDDGDEEPENRYDGTIIPGEDPSSGFSAFDSGSCRTAHYIYI